MKYASFGSISSGTLRNVDLIQAFKGELEWQTSSGRNDRTTEQSALITDADEWLRQNEDNDDDNYTGPDHFCRGDELSAELAEALEEFAPPYAYFGSHVGDGADYGYWPSDMDGFDGLRVSDTSEVPDDYRGEVLHVNDHGNMTLYATDDTGKLVEVWAIV